MIGIKMARWGRRFERRKTAKKKKPSFKRQWRSAFWPKTGWRISFVVRAGGRKKGELSSDAKNRNDKLERKRQNLLREAGRGERRKRWAGFGWGREGILLVLRDQGIEAVRWNQKGRDRSIEGAKGSKGVDSIGKVWFEKAIKGLKFSFGGGVWIGKSSA